MSLTSLDRWRKKLGFKLTFWYAAIFVVSFVGLAVLSYVYLATSVRDNHKVIEARMESLRALERAEGIAAVERRVGAGRAVNQFKAFFVRVIDPKNEAVFISRPRLWGEFDLSLSGPPVTGAWQYLASRKDGDVLEVLTANLSNGFLLQVGKVREDRKEILEHFRDTIVGAVSGMILLGLGGGAFLAFRAMRPLRALTHAAQSIVATGRLDARVPESGAGDELDELTKLFNRMLERIEASVNGMRDALDNVAHDLRTPVTRLRGFLETGLQAETTLQQSQEALANCAEESERILTLLNSLMDISEAETGAIRLKVESLRVADFVADAVELYQYVAEEKNISVSVECAADLLVSGDRSRLRQVMANLLDNAIKYTQPGGKVAIIGRQEDQRAVIHVQDTGSGIPAEELPNIWTRLYRCDKSRSEPGLGLGLSLVKAIVLAHQGALVAQSTFGQGSIFTISFPLGPTLS